MLRDFCKLTCLWFDYLWYLVTCQTAILEATDGETFFISPEAVRGLRMDFKGVRFIGNVCGQEVNFIINLDKVKRITHYVEDNEDYGT